MNSLKSGDRIMITDPPEGQDGIFPFTLHGFYGVVLNVKGDTAEVDMNICGRSAVTEIEARLLKRVDSATQS